MTHHNKWKLSQINYNMSFLYLIIHTSALDISTTMDIFMICRKFLTVNFRFKENMSSQYLSGADANKNQQTWL